MITDKNSGLTVADFAIGDKVRFLRGELHEKKPLYFPPVGTIGTVTWVGTEDLLVQWPCGTTSEDDEWFVQPRFVEKVN